MKLAGFTITFVIFWTLSDMVSPPKNHHGKTARNWPTTKPINIPASTPTKSFVILMKEILFLMDFVVMIQKGL